MAKLSVFDPPMCCSTGVCGPSVDPVLPRFAADLDWLNRQGIDVERYNLAQQPAAFAANPVVTGALRELGNDCLPLVFVNGQVASRGRYPERAELSRFVGLVSTVANEGTPKAASGSCCCSGPEPVAVAIGGATSGFSKEESR